MRARILLLVSAATLLPSTARRVPPTPLEAFRALVSADRPRAAAAEQLIVEGWDDAHASILVELARFAEDAPARRRIISILERTTGRKMGGDLRKSWAWIWRTDPGTHPEYATFKAELYALIDPSFEDYFDESPPAKIRLDRCPAKMW